MPGTSDMRRRRMLLALRNANWSKSTPTSKPCWIGSRGPQTRASSPYEAKITELEETKARLQNQMANHVPPKGKFDGMLELSPQFLANAWKLWESGQIILQRTVLKLAFLDRLTYHRNEGARTPKISFLFKTLTAISIQELRSGADGGT